jgi:hypothetical protein
MRAPASISLTASQNQVTPTSAGRMRTAILIDPGAARRAIKISLMDRGVLSKSHICPGSNLARRLRIEAAYSL